MKKKRSKAEPNLMEKIISLCKRRGFIFPSSEIYGGFRSSYDYGPLGVELKNNVKKSWWRDMVVMRENVVGLDSAILMNPKIWEASGHTTEGFADLLAECKKCRRRYRADHLEGNQCPECKIDLTEPRKFNLLLKTFLGPVEDEASEAYLRGETAQGIYVNFVSVQQSMRLKLPFGIAQVGKSFRNEITPGNFTFRTREFEQMEHQFFVKPKEADKWFEYWRQERMKWYQDSLGIKKDNLKFKKHEKDELAHYAKAAEDIEYNYPFGWDELEGIHNRGDWDLSRHSKFSGEDLSYFDEEKKERYIPHVVETAGGADRITLVALLDAYCEEEVSGEKRVVIRFHKNLAPIKVAVLPLVKNKKELVKKAKEIYDLVKPHFMSMYDETGSVGRRYRRQDEIGTPYCATIDFETLGDKAVTVRDRDSMKQERVKIKELIEWFKGKFKVL